MPGGGRGTVVIIGMRGEPAAAEAGMSLQKPERTVCSRGELVPGSWDPGSGGLHRLPGGVQIVTCTCTQASWWLQQQP